MNTLIDRPQKTIATRKSEVAHYSYQRMESAVGPLYIVSDEHALHGVAFEVRWPMLKKYFKHLSERSTPVIENTQTQLAEYFSGKRTAFELPITLNGTPFQNKAWSALAKIPYGETRTYKQQAEAIQSPKALRAVGRTNGLNRFCIVLPCHRVIGSDGSLTGFAGGLKAKTFLLALESSEKR